MHHRPHLRGRICTLKETQWLWISIKTSRPSNKVLVSAQRSAIIHWFSENLDLPCTNFFHHPSGVCICLLSSPYFEKLSLSGQKFIQPPVFTLDIGAQQTALGILGLCWTSSFWLCLSLAVNLTFILWIWSLQPLPNWVKWNIAVWRGWEKCDFTPIRLQKKARNKNIKLTEHKFIGTDNKVMVTRSKWWWRQRTKCMSLSTMGNELETEYRVHDNLYRYCNISLFLKFLSLY